MKFLWNFGDNITEKKIKKFYKFNRVKKIICLEKTDSTNNEVKRNKDLADFTTFIAKEQTKGRGRSGKTWEDGRGKTICMSILIKPQISPDEISKITILTGLAVFRALLKFGVKSEIKWPNDIVVNKKKICGILSEAIISDDRISVAVGIGINANNKAFDKEISDIATSVFLETGKRVNPSKLAGEILFWEELIYERFLNGEFSALMKEYRENCVTLNKEVKVILADKEFLATAVDVTDSGELLVKKDQEEILLSSGEVSVRGIFGYI